MLHCASPSAYWQIPASPKAAAGTEGNSKTYETTGLTDESHVAALRQVDEGEQLAYLRRGTFPMIWAEAIVKPASRRRVSWAIKIAGAGS